jgi:hypothetical protein
MHVDGFCDDNFGESKVVEEERIEKKENNNNGG